MPLLSNLPPGTRFRVPALGITGQLLMTNECRARVRIDQPQQDVEFTGRDGTPRVFRAARNIETSWTPAVSVEVLSFEPRKGHCNGCKENPDPQKKPPRPRNQPRWQLRRHLPTRGPVPSRRRSRLGRRPTAS